MEISKNGINLIKFFEGLKLDSYKCPADVWTIGIGHTKGVKPFMRINEAQAYMYFNEDVQWCYDAIKSYVKVPLNQNQFDALVSFIFNLGTGNFSKSTLLKLLNQGNYNGAAEEFLKWTLAGGRSLPGLVNRRNAERRLFLKGKWEA